MDTFTLRGIPSTWRTRESRTEGRTGEPRSRLASGVRTGAGTGAGLFGILLMEGLDTLPEAFHLPVTVASLSVTLRAFGRQAKVRAEFLSQAVPNVEIGPDTDVDLLFRLGGPWRLNCGSGFATVGRNWTELLRRLARWRCDSWAVAGF